jgi:hypothetical protein
MPAFLEAKLKSEAAKKGFAGRRAARYVYGAMNDMGAMRGNRETAKGAAMERKHEQKKRLTKDSVARIREKMKGGKRVRSIEIEPAENGGHTVTHHFTSGSTAAYAEPERHVFGAHEGHEMLAHVANHLEIPEQQEENGGSD